MCAISKTFWEIFLQCEPVGWLDCVNQLCVFKFCRYFVFSLTLRLSVWCLFIYVLCFYLLPAMVNYGEYIRILYMSIIHDGFCPTNTNLLFEGSKEAPMQSRRRWWIQEGNTRIWRVFPPPFNWANLRVWRVGRERWVIWRGGEGRERKRRNSKSLVNMISGQYVQSRTGYAVLTILYLFLGSHRTIGKRLYRRHKNVRKC